MRAQHNYFGGNYKPVAQPTATPPAVVYSSTKELRSKTKQNTGIKSSIVPVGVLRAKVIVGASSVSRSVLHGVKGIFQHLFSAPLGMSPSSKFKLGCTQFEDVDKSTIESGNAGLGMGGFVGTLGQTNIHDRPYLRFYSYPAKHIWP